MEDADWFKHATSSVRLNITLVVHFSKGSGSGMFDFF